ncbi:hypothetical protein GCM10027406_36150 [Leifsonia lichenia]
MAHNASGARGVLDRLQQLAHITEDLCLGSQLAGGRNNSVFDVLGAAEPLCIKLYSPQRIENFSREAAMLAVLQNWMPHNAPRLLAASKSDAGLLMSKLPGKPLVGPDVNDGVATQILEVLDTLYSVDVRSAGLLEVPWSAQSMYERVNLMILDSVGADIASVWRRGAERLGIVDLLSPDFRRPCIGRGDPALDNILWDGVTVALVDFEYGGATDVSHEVAEFLEHPQQRSLPTNFGPKLVSELLSSDDVPALIASRWLLRSFWTVRLQGAGSGPLLQRLAELEPILGRQPG